MIKQKRIDKNKPRQRNHSFRGYRNYPQRTQRDVIEKLEKEISDIHKAKMLEERTKWKQELIDHLNQLQQKRDKHVQLRDKAATKYKKDEEETKIKNYERKINETAIQLQKYDVQIIELNKKVIPRDIKAMMQQDKGPKFQSLSQDFLQQPPMKTGLQKSVSPERKEQLKKSRQSSFSSKSSKSSSSDWSVSEGEEKIEKNSKKVQIKRAELDRAQQRIRQLKNSIEDIISRKLQKRKEQSPEQLLNPPKLQDQIAHFPKKIKAPDRENIKDSDDLQSIIQNTSQRESDEEHQQILWFEDYPELNNKQKLYLQSHQLYDPKDPNQMKELKNTENIIAKIMDIEDKVAKQIENGTNDKQGEGKRHEGEKNGLYLSELVRMIVTLIPGVEKFDFNIITNNEEKIQHKKDNVLIIFLKQQHYTCAVYRKDRDEIVYFDPYGDNNKERRKEDFGQIQQLSLELSQELTMKYKFNKIPWQESGINKNDSSWCGFYCFIFLWNYMPESLNESFAQACEFTKKDKEELQKLIPTKQKFPYI